MSEHTHVWSHYDMRGLRCRCGAEWNAQEGVTHEAAGPSHKELQATIDRLLVERVALVEACKKALTCGLNSDVRQLVVAALTQAEGKETK